MMLGLRTRRTRELLPNSEGALQASVTIFPHNAKWDFHITVKNSLGKKLFVIMPIDAYRDRYNAIKYAKTTLARLQISYQPSDFDD